MLNKYTTSGNLDLKMTLTFDLDLCSENHFFPFSDVEMQEQQQNDHLSSMLTDQRPFKVLSMEVKSH